jgi:hypothetical protein
VPFDRIKNDALRMWITFFQGNQGHWTYRQQPMNAFSTKPKLQSGVCAKLLTAMKKATAEARAGREADVGANIAEVCNANAAKRTRGMVFDTCHNGRGLSNHPGR